MKPTTDDMISHARDEQTANTFANTTGNAVSAHHGGFHAEYFRAMQRTYDPALDFSVNINPWGPSSLLRSRLRKVEYSAYPDPQNLLVREAIATSIGATPAEVIVDAGSSRILWAIVRTFLPKNGHALVVDPTFGEFHRAVFAQNATLHRVRRDDGERWTLSFESVSNAIRACGAAIVYLCDPNNPTGELLPPTFIPRLAHAHPQTLFIWDEAYRFLTRRPDDRVSKAPDNVVRLQSLTKEQGVPGLRIGYAVMHEDLSARLTAQRPAWCCGSAEEIGIRAAVEAREELPTIVAHWFEARDAMVSAARSAGFNVQTADAPWFLIRGVRPTALRDAAVHEEGLLMRDCTSFGIPDALRVCPRLPEANARWMAWIQKQCASSWAAERA